MAKWLLIPLKESSGCGPVVGIAALVMLFVGGMLVGLTGELIQVQILGNTTPIKERGAGASFLIGGIVWLVFGLVVYIIVRRRRRR